ncbi:MoaD/ThiS family protein [Microbacterium lushaniae]|uniref:MoaD/ThiS family protein n=1 Tax=Microbacterium lushaniae TaxID=2614639 RepID=A0A5J5J8P0_9MICO|nr:MoaD/ThiS family protein [Microbacterium lushaniae]KAA9146292.1 MoaD/ThiS family protein [Microbacterium lushaniae]KAA9150243.1 MoaD/ThiS family protein [Microbacterium lushaniae]QEW03979.1 MoaD/ThiS family protein [Microbacterium lushaniae]
MMRVRFFAAAAEAAGTDVADRSEPTLDALRAALVHDHPDLGAVLPRCAVLVDGVRADADVPLTGTSVIDVLPPFAGG